ncbi:hypothetical protein [Pseudoalteromonas simplex]|uniref:hypothetical protein n=1 Tax=Pseudoalteromonas simplex TaxID=2783613 RepID=UPI0018886726|nr:hypothetical protein [Pseudoalteromonas sp. A520]
MPTIDFTNIAGRIYAGRPNGIKAREFFNVNALDSEEANIQVIFPDNARSISSSFFLGMFGESIRRAGSKEEFMEHFEFRANPHIREQISKVVDRAIVAMNYNP